MRLIDADALRKSLYNGGKNFDRVHGNEHFIYGIETAIEAIDYAPTVDPVKHGRWIEIDDGFKNCLYKCSECGTKFMIILTDYHFCPYCGAKMDSN